MLDAAWAGGAAVAVGERGGIWVSQGGTGPWKRIPPIVGTDLNAVTFVGQAGWAVGHDGVILATQDGGRHWRLARRAEQGQPALFDVWFQTPQQGFAVGAFGAYLRTADGGRTWRTGKLPSGDRHIYAAMGLENRWFLAGESGTLLVSSDMGVRWRVLDAGTSNTLFGFAALPGQEALVFGFRGTVCRSTDRGMRWRPENIKTDETLAGGAAGPRGVYLAGSRGTLWLGTDGKRFAPLSAGHSLSTILPLGGDQVALLGEEGITTIEAAVP